MAREPSDPSAATQQQHSGRRFWAGPLPLRRAALLVAVLALLALGTTYLLQRRAAQGAQAEFASHGRSLAALVAQAVGTDGSLSESARLTRILESTARHSGLRAGAILAGDGRVLAHTDLTRRAERIALPTPMLDSDGALPADVRTALFGPQAGAVFSHPVINADGAAGLVTLLLARPHARVWGPDLLHFLLPTGLILLAMIALLQVSTRWALRPTLRFLEHLTQVLAPPDGGATQPGATAEPDHVLAQTVSWMTEIKDEREALTIQNRMLEYERRRVTLVLEHLPDGLVVADAGGDIVFVNRTARGMLPRGTETDAPAAPAAAAEIAPERGPLPAAAQELLAEARQRGQLLHETTAGEKRRHILINRIPLPGTLERTAGMLFHLRDVTAQQAAQQAQAEFLSQISHELKSPLNTIVAYVEALDDEELVGAEERREFYNTINQEAMRMARLISNLLQLSRIQLGNLSARFGFVKADALLRDMAASVTAQIEQHGLKLDLQVPENLPPLFGDKDLLGVAVTNLLSNAIKYTPSGGRISLRAAEDEKGITVEVADTGIGIPPEAQAKIFERFARSDQEEVQQQSGTGLGLALVREIAEIHEGNVTLESEIDSGSRFRLWIPSREAGTRFDLGAA